MMGTSRRTMPRMAVAVGLLLGMSIVFVARSRTEHEGTASSNAYGPGVPALIDWAHPLGPEVRETSLDQAVSSAPIPGLRPQTDIASDQNIEGVWVRYDAPAEIFLRYDSGVDIALRRPDFAEGFKSFYTGEIHQGYPGQLTDVSGIPVFLVPTETQNAYVEADFVVDEVFVQVIAAKGSLTAEGLTALVQSTIESAKSAAI